ncbi:hypothetical protein BMETH_1213_0 [methanotrophic bacterial endosymbiont of Bathymodiolus sp.]|nr:hypothetical protein BMETH_1213_0 [methanotrophic bacterial endosymbiont of Bathymodiolus sp.]
MKQVSSPSTVEMARNGSLLTILNLNSHKQFEEMQAVAGRGKRYGRYYAHHCYSPFRVHLKWTSIILSTN